MLRESYQRYSKSKISGKNGIKERFKGYFLIDNKNDPKEKKRKALEKILEKNLYFSITSKSLFKDDNN